MYIYGIFVAYSAYLLHIVHIFCNVLYIYIFSLWMYFVFTCSLLSFEVFMDVQEALWSCAVLSMNIHIKMQNMQNMQNMLHIKFLLFMQDIANGCNSHRTWDTKFNACLRTICQHIVNAAMGPCAWTP